MAKLQAVLLALVALHNANVTNMMSMFDNLLTHRREFSLDEHQNVNLTVRNVRPWLYLPGLGLEDLDNWGCWCHFGSDDPQQGEYRGHGEPVDGKIDPACRALRHAYDCAKLDSDESGDLCVPWDVNYNSGVVFGDTEAVNKMCEDYNHGRSNCEYYACSAEANFITELFNMIFLEGLRIPQEYSHARGFNPFEECHGPAKLHSSDEGMYGLRSMMHEEMVDHQGTADRGSASRRDKPSVSERKCCGEYPYRAPYQTLGGAHACCSDKVFDTSKHCCIQNDIFKADECALIEETVAQYGSVDPNSEGIYEDYSGDDLIVDGIGSP